MFTWISQSKTAKFWMICALVCLACVLITEVRTAPERHRIAAAWAKAERNGEPLTTKQIAAWYNAPPLETNTAELYAKAAKMYVCEPDEIPYYSSTVELPPLGKSLTAEMMAAMERYVTENCSYLKLVHEAAQGSCRFRLDFAKLYNMPLDHLAPLRNNARGLCVEATFWSERGDLARAVNSLIDAFRVGEALRHEPVLISHMVRIATHGPAVSALERTLSRAALSDAELMRLDGVLRDIECDEGQSTAFSGERWILPAQMDLLVANADPDFTEYVVRQWREVKSAQIFGSIALAAANTDIERFYAFDIMNQMFEASKRPPHERIAASERWKKRLEELPPTCYLIRMLCPALSYASINFVRDLANLHMARVSVAVERYRLAHGALPETLDALAPVFLAELPPDPFTGKALYYKRLEPGFMVYSAGADRIDDGGDEREPRNARYPGPADHAFRVAR
jgi:hypothetical protein